MEIDSRVLVGRSIGMDSGGVPKRLTHRPYVLSSVRLLRRAHSSTVETAVTRSRAKHLHKRPDVAKAVSREPAARGRRERFAVEEADGELVIRVRLDGAPTSDALPAVITQRNCEQVGLAKRQFLELVRAGTIPGGPLPGTRIIAARLEDVLQVVEQASATSTTNEQQPQHDDQDDVDAVLAAVGQQRRPGGR